MPTVLTRRRYVRNQGKGNIDLAGCVFYAPLWRPDLGNQPTPAMSFDGNDYLSNATANFRSGDSAGAIEVWFRSSSTANNQTVFASSDTGTATSFFDIRIMITTGYILIHTRDNAGTEYGVRGNTNVCDGKWHLIVISASSSAWSIFLDGVAESLTVTDNSNKGDWFANVTLRDNITIGAKTATSTANYTIGVQGFTRIYSRAMLAPEALTNFQRGRMASASDATGLVFNLPMTEGTGNPVDTVGSLTMTATGATWITDTQFYSRDSSPKLLTVQGATWGNQGRALNGTSDKIIVTGSLGSIKAAGAWVYPDDNTTRSIMDFDAGTHSIELDGSGDVTATGWDTPTIYVNGVVAAAVAQSAWSFVFVTTATAFTASAVVLGQEASYFDGKMGDALAFSAIPTSIMQLTQNTRWRYAS